MKVKELIEKLNQCDPEIKVCIYDDERDCDLDIERVKERQVEKSYDPKTNKMSYEPAVVFESY
jgi:hypothetical protein